MRQKILFIRFHRLLLIPLLFIVWETTAGTSKPGQAEATEYEYAAVHQRMGIYVSSDNRLLATGYYGICLFEGDSPADGDGIGRVVRGIYPDGDDPLTYLQDFIPAMSYYQLEDGRFAGIGKLALGSVSNDGGRSWSSPVKTPGFVTKMSKVWEQKTSQGKYAVVYNPTEYRWPLAVSLSEDGLLHAEVQDKKGMTAVRLVFDRDGVLKAKAGYNDTLIQTLPGGRIMMLRTRGYNLHAQRFI